MKSPLSVSWPRHEPPMPCPHQCTHPHHTHSHTHTHTLSPPLSTSLHLSPPLCMWRKRRRTTRCGDGRAAHAGCVQRGRPVVFWRFRTRRSWAPMRSAGRGHKAGICSRQEICTCHKHLCHAEGAPCHARTHTHTPPQSPSLDLSNTHTRTHTHTLSLSLSRPLSTSLCPFSFAVWKVCPRSMWAPLKLCGDGERSRVCLGRQHTEEPWCVEYRLRLRLCLHACVSTLPCVLLRLMQSWLLSCGGGGGGGGCATRPRSNPHARAPHPHTRAIASSVAHCADLSQRETHSLLGEGVFVVLVSKGSVLRHVCCAFPPQRPMCVI